MLLAPTFSLLESDGSLEAVVFLVYSILIQLS